MIVTLELGSKQVQVEIPNETQGALDCVIDGRALAADAQAVQPGVISLVVAGRQFWCVRDGDSVVVNGQRFAFAVVDRRSLRGNKNAARAADGPRSVKAPMPGRIVRLMVSVGDEVVAQQGLVVMEAMKMQNELRSPKAGRVARISVAVGDTVQSGYVLIVVE